jgi:hypothetical protein
VVRPERAIERSPRCQTRVSPLICSSNQVDAVGVHRQNGLKLVLFAADQTICNQQVIGSNPIAGSLIDTLLRHKAARRFSVSRLCPWRDSIGCHEAFIKSIDGRGLFVSIRHVFLLDKSPTVLLSRSRDSTLGFLARAFLPVIAGTRRRLLSIGFPQRRSFVG